MTPRPVKETGLCFKDDMVRAVLARRKHLTHRLLPPGVEIHANGYLTRPNRNERMHPYRCPYGRAGDRVLIREAWCALFDDCTPVPRPFDITEGPWENIAYRADHIDPDGDGPANPMSWRPSIHMPRWACRLVLPILSIRLVRLMDLSEEDAIAEGARFMDFGRNRWGQPRPGWSLHDPFPESSDMCLSSARSAFGNYVNECYAGPDWNLKPNGDLASRNPWCWRIEFDPAGIPDADASKEAA